MEDEVIEYLDRYGEVIPAGELLPDLSNVVAIRRARLVRKDAAMSEAPRKLWLWRNGDHFLAFDNPCPCYPGPGDPLTLGEPVAVAILTPSTPGWSDWDEDGHWKA